jgi:hypothetical protein
MLPNTICRANRRKNTKWFCITNENAATSRISAPPENSSSHSETVGAYAKQDGILHEFRNSIDKKLSQTLQKLCNEL